MNKIDKKIRVKVSLTGFEIETCGYDSKDISKLIMKMFLGAILFVSICITLSRVSFF